MVFSARNKNQMSTNHSRVQGVGWAASKPAPKISANPVGDTKLPGFSAKVEYLENQVHTHKI